MTVIRPRPQGEVPRIVGRPPNDYARQLEEYLEDIDAIATAVNQILAGLDVDAGGGTVTIEGSGGSIADVFMLMGA